ncbi:MAG: 3-deoxy-manno-octulosonate cytidylyltransferase [Nitrospirales bacterium]
MKKKIIAIVPARLKSSRFPSKPLARILDLPMVEHVRRRALLCELLDEVYVATCDEAIMNVVLRAGGKAVMTADTHERCTERVEEAMYSLNGDVVAIVQGDEPLLLPEAIRQVVSPFLENDTLVCTNLVSPIESAKDFDDPDIVKAATDQNGFIMFFSRAPIPYFRQRGACPVYRQTGIWAFNVDFLKKYSSLAPTPFEQVEAIDMLRLLEHGYRILAVPTNYETVGVDRAEDVGKVEHILRTDPVQKALYQQIAPKSL